MKHHTPPLPDVATEKELNGFLLKHLGANLEQAIRSTVSVLVKTEMRQLREELWRDRKEWHDFNGHYTRNLLSPAGKVTAIPIPRFRDGNSGYALQSMGMFDDERGRFRELMAALHLEGVSQRKINALCRRMFGTTFSPSSTQAAFQELLQEEAFRVNDGTLADAPRQFLFLDGVWMSVRSLRTGETTKKVALVALGMDEQGNKKLLGFSEAFAEDEASWRKFLELLETRGLVFSNVRCVSADDGAGLQAALERVSPETPVQLCLTHRYRNVLKYTSHQHKKAIGQDLRLLTKTQTAEQFRAHVALMQQRWQTIAPRAMKSLLQHLDRATTYFQFPASLWTMIRTTNPLERTFREVRRRTATQNHHFTTPQSSTDYHTAIFGALNQTYFKKT